MKFLEQFQSQVKQDTAHAALTTMKSHLENALPTMRSGKILLIEVMCVKAVEQHKQAVANENEVAMSECRAVMAAQESWVSSNTFGVSSEMFHANLWKTAISLGK